MKTKTIKAVLCVGLLAGAARASAAQQSFPTPAPSGSVDTESSVNVPLPDWPELGRHVKIDLTAYATPSNAIQIAFGQDENGDENLEPEETALVIGVDCGVLFTREEGQGWRSRSTVEVIPPSSTSTSNVNLYTFTFKQPQSLAERLSFAKVTTWGREDTAAQIAAEIKKPGIVLFLR